MTEHDHDYRLATHVDGCHWYASVYVCRTCGDVQHRGQERDFHDPDDPYSRVWLVDDCPRCEALMAGAERKALA